MSHEPDPMGAAGRSPTADPTNGPVYEVTLWPHKSLSGPGLRWLVIGSCCAYAIPILAFFGTAAMYVLTVIAAFHVWMLWFFVRRNAYALSLTETLRLWPHLVTVDRQEPNGRIRHWEANPYWVRLTIHKDARPENYLTLKGGGREIELGAFLSPQERLSLKDEIEAAIHGLRR